MDKIVVEGGNRLRGEVRVSGAKNAALPILCSAMLAGEKSIFHNVPKLQDVATMARLLSHLGCRIEEEGGAVAIDGSAINHFDAPYELVKTMRASVLVLGPLLARFGQARISLPGGCAIGARPIDLHLRGLEAMGAHIELVHGYVEAGTKGLRGAHIVCDTPTVTGTENLMMAATLADGHTVIENAAREPEVEELAQVLNKMGAKVKGAGTSVVNIEGVEKLRGIEHRIIPDRIEAGTFMIAAAATNGDVWVRDCVPEHLDAVIAKLRSAGVWVDVENDSVRIRRKGPIKPVDITTQPHPGFPTDMQAQFMVLAAISDGQSVLTETIFENRYMHVQELARMGADIHVTGRNAVVRGVPQLSGATVMATDLRASASLVIAGLIAEGTTEVGRVYHLDRGYERIEEKLRPLGAKIERVRA